MKNNAYIISKEGNINIYNRRGIMFRISDFPEQHDKLVSLLNKMNSFQMLGTTGGGASTSFKKQIGLSELFDTPSFRKVVRQNLPYFFQIVQNECSKGRQAGMGVGTEREKVLIGLLINRFGADVNTNTPVMQAELDVVLGKRPISVKTKTGPLSGIKLSWTVDAERVKYFRNSYTPSCDMLFAHILWDSLGGLYLISVETQKDVLNQMGRENYMKLPKPGTNPRGIEFTKEAMNRLIYDDRTRFIEIHWKRYKINQSPYDRWTKNWNKVFK